MRAKECVFISPINQEKQRGDVSRNGAGADLLVVRPWGIKVQTSSGQSEPEKNFCNTL
jgi:hypothetical protein